MVVEQDPELQRVVIAANQLLEEHGDQLNQWTLRKLKIARRQVSPYDLGAIEFADRLSGSVPFLVAKALEWVYAVDTGEMSYLCLRRGMGYFQLNRFTKHAETALVEAGRRKTLKDLLVLRLQGLNHSF